MPGSIVLPVMRQNFKNMRKITVKIREEDYLLFEITVFKNTPNQKTILVAEERLEERIRKAIEQEDHQSVEDIDGMYEYYVPQEIADDAQEWEIIDSIESVMKDYI